MKFIKIEESDMNLEETFDANFEINAWGNQESKSGPGSTLQYTTNIRQEIVAFCEQFQIKTLFDSPCGDFNWMQHVKFSELLSYIGGDIVTKIISQNDDKFSSSKRSFIKFDITKDLFPNADVWFCRDCLFHLSYRDIFKALTNFVNSDISFLFMTNHMFLTPFGNVDITSGGFRVLDFCLVPFGLPRDVSFWAGDYIHPHPRREMCVWTKEQIAAALPSMATKMLLS